MKRREPNLTAPAPGHPRGPRSRRGQEADSPNYEALRLLTSAATTLGRPTRSRPSAPCAQHPRRPSRLCGANPAPDPAEMGPTQGNSLSNRISTLPKPISRIPTVISHLSPLISGIGTLTSSISTGIFPIPTRSFGIPTVISCVPKLIYTLPMAIFAHLTVISPIPTVISPLRKPISNSEITFPTPETPISSQKPTFPPPSALSSLL